MCCHFWCPPLHLWIMLKFCFRIIKPSSICNSVLQVLLPLSMVLDVFIIFLKPAAPWSCFPTFNDSAAASPAYIFAFRRQMVQGTNTARLSACTRGKSKPGSGGAIRGSAGKGYRRRWAVSLYFLVFCVMNRIEWRWHRIGVTKPRN